MKKIKITKWGMAKVQCITAVKDLMDLTLQGAEDVVKNSEMPCVLKVYDDEKLKVFKDYTQTCCSGMNYTVEDADSDVDEPNEETSEDYSEETLLAIAKMEKGQNCIGEAKQMFLSQIRFLNTSLKGVVSHKEKLLEKNNMLQAEVEKLKANNNNDLCIQLREEIACLKRDNGVLKESNNTFVETIRDQEKQIRDLEKENNILREGKKIVEANNDSLMIANKSLREDVQRLNEVLQAIKNLAF